MDVVDRYEESALAAPRVLKLCQMVSVKGAPAWQHSACAKRAPNSLHDVASLPDVLTHALLRKWGILTKPFWPVVFSQYCTVSELHMDPSMNLYSSCCHSISTASKAWLFFAVQTVHAISVIPMSCAPHNCQTAGTLNLHVHSTAAGGGRRLGGGAGRGHGAICRGDGAEAALYCLLLLMGPQHYRWLRQEDARQIEHMSR